MVHLCSLNFKIFIIYTANVYTSISSTDIVDEEESDAALEVSTDIDDKADAYQNDDCCLIFISSRTPIMSECLEKVTFHHEVDGHQVKQDWEG